MKNLLFAGGITIATATSSQAAVLSILNLEANDNGTTISGFGVTSEESGDPTIQTYTLTQTGDLDGGLGADDTLTFTLVSKYYLNSSIDGSGNVTLGTQTDASDANRNWGASVAAELSTITFEITSITYTSAESTVAFKGFDQLTKVSGNPANSNALEMYIGTTGATKLDVGTGSQNFSLTSGGTSDFVAITTDYNDSETGNIRLRQLDLSFETTAAAVPEPSSTALLGLGGLALILRRRK